MDIALCIIDYDNLKLQYAGANNQLLLIRDHNLSEYKADRFPVGAHSGEFQPFTNNEIDLKKNDLLYIFSDGYIDQVGVLTERNLNRIISNNCCSITMKNRYWNKKPLSTCFLNNGRVNTSNSMMFWL